LEVGQHTVVQTVKAVRLDRLINLAPPDRIFGAGLVDNVFVARSPASIETGGDREAAAKTEFALAPPYGVLVKHRRHLVPMLGPQMVHTLPFEPKTAFWSGHRIALFIDRFLPFGQDHEVCSLRSRRTIQQRLCQSSLSACALLARCVGEL